MFESIDPDRIGISGYSAGGAAALGAAGGWAVNGIDADRRIKAMALYEPGVDSLAYASTIAFPYLVMGGTQNRGGLRIPPLFDGTVDGLVQELSGPQMAASRSYKADGRPSTDEKVSLEQALREAKVSEDVISDLVSEED